MERPDQSKKLADIVPIGLQIGNAEKGEVGRIRRKRVAKGLGLVAGGLFGVVGSINVLINSNSHDIDQEVARIYPQPAQEVIQSSTNTVASLELKAVELAKINQRALAEATLGSEDYSASQLNLLIEKDRASNATKLQNQLHHDQIPIIIFRFGYFLVGVIVSSVNSAIGVSLIARRKSTMDQLNQVNAIDSAVRAIHPEWREKPPDEENFLKFRKAILSLPPVGGKIPLVIGDELNSIGPLEPSLTAEEQSYRVNLLRIHGRLGNGYIHQLTVQGRLRDQFKFMALALILNSPYSNDWNIPFHSAPWGQVAPMVHDGGFYRDDLNRNWSAVAGRTDFLQRVVGVRLANLERLEKQGIKQVLDLSPEILEEATAEQQERGRLLLEARAYQRLALALHASENTAPKSIPRQQRKQLANQWKEFKTSMYNLLVDYGLQDIAKTKWFSGKQRHMYEWPGKRFEADWLPIQADLIRLEAVREQHPEMRQRTNKLLFQSASNIDRIIGLN